MTKEPYWPDLDLPVEAQFIEHLCGPIKEEEKDEPKKQLHVA